MFTVVAVFIFLINLVDLIAVNFTAATIDVVVYVVFLFPFSLPMGVTFQLF